MNATPKSVATIEQAVVDAQAHAAKLISELRAQLQHAGAEQLFPAESFVVIEMLVRRSFVSGFVNGYEKAVVLAFTGAPTT